MYGCCGSISMETHIAAYIQAYPHYIVCSLIWKVVVHVFRPRSASLLKLHGPERPLCSGPIWTLAFLLYAYFATAGTPSMMAGVAIPFSSYLEIDTPLCTQSWNSDSYILRNMTMDRAMQCMAHCWPLNCGSYGMFQPGCVPLVCIW